MRTITLSVTYDPTFITPEQITYLMTLNILGVEQVTHTVSAIPQADGDSRPIAAVAGNHDYRDFHDAEDYPGWDFTRTQQGCGGPQRQTVTEVCQMSVGQL